VSYDSLSFKLKTRSIRIKTYQVFWPAFFFSVPTVKGITATPDNMDATQLLVIEE
jgi:hypothetical protein